MICKIEFGNLSRPPILVERVPVRDNKIGPLLVSQSVISCLHIQDVHGQNVFNFLNQHFVSNVGPKATFFLNLGNNIIVIYFMIIKSCIIKIVLKN